MNNKICNHHDWAESSQFAKYTIPVFYLFFQDEIQHTDAIKVSMFSRLNIYDMWQIATVINFVKSSSLQSVLTLIDAPEIASPLSWHFVSIEFQKPNFKNHRTERHKFVKTENVLPFCGQQFRWCTKILLIFLIGVIIFDFVYSTWYL